MAFSYPCERPKGASRFLVRYVLFSLSAFLFTAPAIAGAKWAYSGVQVEDISGGRDLFIAEIYDRYQYPVIAGTFTIDNFDNGWQRFVVEDGETWQMKLELTDPLGNNVHLATATIRYNGSTQCLEFQGEPIRCNFYIPEGETGLQSQTVAIRYFTQCLPEDLVHRMRAFHNDVEITEKSPKSFTPVRFKPEVRDVIFHSPMRPSIKRNGIPQDKPVPAEEAQSSLITVTVGPDLACGVPLEGVDVEMKTRVRVSEDAGGHTHIIENETGGTGSFEGGTDAADSSEKPSISGKTDRSGRFRATYTPGDFGIGETLEIKVSRTIQTSEEPVESEHEEDFDIMVDGLQMLQPSSSGEFVFVQDPVNCAHNPASRYLTPDTSRHFIVLSDLYSVIIGRRLSFNDASTIFGGILDDAVAGDRSNPCHDSHRRGIDIDINRKDGGGLDGSGIANMVTVETSLNGVDVPLWIWVTETACDIGLHRVPEGTSFHLRNYRGCSNARLEPALEDPDEDSSNAEPQGVL